MRLGWVVDTFLLSDDGATTRFEFRVGWYFQWWRPWFEFIFGQRFWLVGWVPCYLEADEEEEEPYEA